MILYCETSLCLQTGAAGWAATVVQADWTSAVHGPLSGQRAYGQNLIDIACVHHALDAVLASGALEGHKDVTIALRNVAPMAILRWVRPEAPYTGKHIDMPKRLPQHVRHFTLLQSIDDTIDLLDLHVSLALVEDNPHSLTARDRARLERNMLLP